MASEQSTIQSASDFAKDDAGAHQRWNVEITAAKKETKSWHNQAKKLVDRFLDRRKNSEETETRINLFSANIQTQRSMLYGKTPKADVVRRFEDADDDVARVAALILERILNTHIEDDSDNYSTAIALALDDRLLVGMGNVRLRYEADFDDAEPVEPQLDAESGEELAPGYTPAPEKTREEVKIDYVHWRDQLWSPARTWEEIRWWAFRVYMTQDEMDERFGKTKARKVPLSKRSGDRNDSVKNDPWSRAEVWEVWSKEDRKVYWYAEGAGEILDTKDDPLELEGFLPCPRPMVANLTTDTYLPRPDFVMAQDLYNEIDYVSTRITLLERAVKVVGVYDKSADGVRRILTEGFDNDLVAVDNWALFAERGGLRGTIDWLPVDVVVGCLDKLRDYRGELIKLLYEVTGLSDIMRGEQESGETATTSALKAKFASVRMQSSQDEFARFATDVLRLKSEIICRHCDDQTIMAESNILHTKDAQLAQPALELLRSESAKYRVEVKPENVSMTDLAALKAERLEFIQALTMMMQATGPMIQAQPEVGPFILELLKWGVAGFRGAASIEGVIDQAIMGMKQKLMQPPPPPQPDPKDMMKMQIEKARGEADIAVSNVKARNDIQVSQQRHAIDQQKLQLDAAKAQMDMQKMVAKARLEAQTALHATPGEMLKENA